MITDDPDWIGGINPALQEVLRPQGNAGKTDVRHLTTDDRNCRCGFIRTRSAKADPTGRSSNVILNDSEES